MQESSAHDHSERLASNDNNKPVITCIPVGPLQCNCIIFGDPKTKECLIVDPGGDADKIVEHCQGWQLRYILITHAHFDHILAAGEVKSTLEKQQALNNIQIALHPDDLFLYNNLPLQCQTFGIHLDSEAKDLPAPDIKLKDGLTLTIGDGEIVCTVLHCPGHTPGSCCFLFEEKQTTGKVLASGDTLFCCGIGRTDFPGGDATQLMRSIRDKLYVLPDHVPVIPGHGQFTTIGKEKQGNPFTRHAHANTIAKL